MTKFTDSKMLPYSAEQMFNLVTDVARYPEFLPWVTSASVHDKVEDHMLAELQIGYKFFRESYTSEITMERPGRVEVRAIKGPFSKLENIWTFTPMDDNYIRVDFFIDFEFDSPILSSMMSGVFEDAARQMIKAFEQRAAELYGSNNHELVQI